MGSAQLQGRLWGAGARDWADLTEPTMLPVYHAVFDEIGIGAGTKLLDVGCGAGLALQIARKRGANVTGLDAAAPLIAVARERCPDADLREGELEELPFGGASFNAVTSFNAVQYASDPVAALRELRRVSVPGSPVVLVTWAVPEQCETRAVLAAIGGLLPPPPPGAGGPFALSAPGRLEELASKAGLTPGRAQDVEAPFVFADLATAVRAHLSSGPARRAIEHAGEDAVTAVLREALGGSVQSDGCSRHRNAFRFLVATA